MFKSKENDRSEYHILDYRIRNTDLVLSIGNWIWNVRFATEFYNNVYDIQIKDARIRI